MAVISTLLFLLIITNINFNFGMPGVIYQEILPAVNETFNMTSHLEYTHIQKVCNSRYSICKSNNTNVCGMRHYQNQVQYQDFENSCFMFLTNMCDNPGEEYYILASGLCKDFFINRRQQKKARRDEDDDEADEGVTAYQEAEETNTEQKTESYKEETEENEENYTGGNDESEQDEATEVTERNESDEETKLFTNDEKTEPIEKENDTTTQSVDAYIDAIEDTETDVTTPVSRIKHPKSALMRGNKGSKTTPTKEIRNMGKNTKSITKRAKKKKIFTDAKTGVTIPPLGIKHSKAALRKPKSTKSGKSKSTKAGNTKSTKAGKSKNTKAVKSKSPKAGKSNSTKAGKSKITKAGNPTSTKAGKPESTKAGKQKSTKTGKPRTTQFTLYPVDVAFDDHICPLSCPTTYSPVCVSANRGHGIYFKFFTFINHCFGDIYYCKHPDDFKPPPDEDEENVIASPLSWSFCAASRYIQFARFTEVASSMGHYGWLAGNYRPTHIMEPHERLRGYG